ncbi:MAG: superoxide dismutase [Xenococcaceae cyanobacterium]
MVLNRRNFLIILGAATGTAALNNFAGSAIAQSSTTGGNSKPETSGGQNAQTTPSTDPKALPFMLAPLPYAYDALEPHIDAETMKIHHDRHHATYVKNLNEAVNKYPQLKNRSVDNLIANLDSIPAEVRTKIRNNGGGHLNHTMFWEIMGPNAGGEPKGAIAEAIQKGFGSFSSFQNEFNEAGKARFGSGWAWLVMDKNKQLKVTNTANQDSPLMEGLFPIMGNDVWEHAYYLKYRNKRDEYLKQWWNVVNWNEVEKRYQQATT